MTRKARFARIAYDACLARFVFPGPVLGPFGTRFCVIVGPVFAPFWDPFGCKIRSSISTPNGWISLIFVKCKGGHGT